MVGVRGEARGQRPMVQASHANHFLCGAGRSEELLREGNVGVTFGHRLRMLEEDYGFELKIYTSSSEIIKILSNSLNLVHNSGF